MNIQVNLKWIFGEDGGFTYGEKKAWWMGGDVAPWVHWNMAPRWRKVCG